MSSRGVLEVNRRTALALGGASVLATGLPALHAQADVPVVPQDEFAPATEFQLGEFKVFAFLDGSFLADQPQDTFGMEQSPEVFEEASRAHYIPADKFRGYFTPTLVNTQDQIILFDTGRGALAQPNAGNLLKGMAAVGIKPEDVDVVVLTHMHGDHIGGMMHNGQPVFSNARFVTNPMEFEYWEKLGPDAGGSARAFAQNVLPLKDKFTFITPGDEVVPGITAVEAYGHTPGHTIYLLEANGRKLMLTADTANHFVWSLAYPDWKVRFDIDKDKAAETRRRVFGMLADERIPFIGYHMPYPSLGFVERNGDGFQFIPSTYQLQLGHETEDNRPE